MNWIMRCRAWRDQLAWRAPACHSFVIGILSVIALGAFSPVACWADAKSEGPLYGKVELRFQRTLGGRAGRVSHW